MTAKQSQHDAAESLFGAIIAILDKHAAAHTLTEQVVERWPGHMRQWRSVSPTRGRWGHKRGRAGSIAASRRAALPLTWRALLSTSCRRTFTWPPATPGAEGASAASWPEGR